MAWTTPRTWTVGEIVTKAIMDTHVKDNLRYLHGDDGATTLANALILPDGAGYYLHIPNLTTTQRDALTPTAGMLIYNSTTTQFNKYENGAWRADLGFNSAHANLSGLTTGNDHTQYAQKQFFVPCYTGTGGALSVDTFAGYILQAADIAVMTFRLPNDFTAVTTVKIIILPIGATGTFDWTAATTFGAHGEAYNVHTDTSTADTQAGTSNQLLELDISASFTGVAANDIINLTFTLDAIATLTSIGILGLDIKYS